MDELCHKHSKALSTVHTAQSFYFLYLTLTLFLFTNYFHCFYFALSADKLASLKQIFQTKSPLNQDWKAAGGLLMWNICAGSVAAAERLNHSSV